MTKEELQTQADELQKQLTALNEKIANCKDEPKMFPQKFEGYWHYNPQGIIDYNVAQSSEGRVNAFRTQEEAKKAVDIQRAKQRVAHRIVILNDGWMPDWENSCQDKYFIRRNEAFEIVPNYCWTLKDQPDWMYCKSKEIVEQIILECCDDLLLIFSE